MSLGVCFYFHIGGAINFSWEPMNSLATIVIVLALWSISFHVIARTNRFLNLLNCWCDPTGVKGWMADLDSPNLLRKSLAVQTMADYFGRNLGGMENWPFAEYRSDELETYSTFIKKLWAAKEATVPECPSQKRLLRQLARKMKNAFWRVAQCRVDWLISQIPEYFRRVTASRDRIFAVSDPMIRVTTNALDPLPPLHPARLIQAMQARVTDTLEKAGQIINDSPAGALVVDSEEPVGEVFARLFLEAYQVGLLLRLGSSEIDPMELFTPERSSFRKARNEFAALLTRIGELVKDGLMDLSFLEERVRPEEIGDELPYMSAEEFVQTMRPRVEQALQQFVEITNQTPDGLILFAEETSVCRIFAKLHAQALESGLELRLRRAESLGLLGKGTEKQVATPLLRKAASPGLPPPFMGWAAKYRCMRIAGTRFPLIHQGPEKSESTSSQDDPHVTSVKPGPGAT
jgi:hypothetical protein